MIPLTTKWLTVEEEPLPLSLLFIILFSVCMYYELNRIEPYRLTFSPYLQEERYTFNLFICPTKGNFEFERKKYQLKIERFETLNIFEWCLTGSGHHHQ